MPINMNCPSCGKTLSAPETAAGKKAKCPSCGQVMIVPEVVHDAEDLYAPAPEPAPGPSAPLGSESSAGSPQSWLDEAQGPAAAPTAAGQARRPCPMCGEQIIATAAKCRFCGAVLDARLRGGAAGIRPDAVPNYLAQAILVTLFCCLPFGIVAIVYAAQVNGRLQAGDIAGPSAHRIAQKLGVGFPSAWASVHASSGSFSL